MGLKKRGTFHAKILRNGSKNAIQKSIVPEHHNRKFHHQKKVFGFLHCQKKKFSDYAFSTKKNPVKLHQEILCQKRD